MDEPDQHDRADSQHGGIARSQAPIGDRPAQNLIADEKEKEEQRAREPGVPGPPRAPNRLPPDRTRGEDDAREHRANFGRRFREAIEPRILEEQIEDTGEPEQNHRQLRRDGGRDVHVEDLLRGTLEPFHRRERQRPHIHAAEQDQPRDHEPTTLLRHRHSSTVYGKSQEATAKNTMSYAASNLSQPATSLKGRSARRRAVA